MNRRYWSPPRGGDASDGAASPSARTGEVASIDGVPAGGATAPPIAVPANLHPLTALEERLLAGPLAVSKRKPARDEDFLSGDWSGAGIRAEVIRWLAEAGVEIDVEGAEITGSLDLSDSTLPSRLRLRRCLFREPIDVSRSTLVTLDLSGSCVSELKAAGLRCDTLSFGNRGVAGRVNISTAELGHISFTGLLLDAPNDDNDVLDARVLTTSRSADFNRGFEAQGRCRFIGASIGGQLNFRNAVFHAALSLHETTVSRALYLREGLFRGPVSLAEARIAGRLDATDATFAAGTSKALRLNGTTVERTAQFTRVVVSGTISIRNSTIKGSLRLGQAVLRAPAPDATVRQQGQTSEQAAAVSGTVLAALPTHIERRAQEIARQEWEAPGTQRSGIETQEPDVALRIDSSSIGSALILTAAAVDGSVDISAISVGGRVDVGSAHLGRGAEGDALRLSESTIGGTLALRRLASLTGRVDLSRTAVGWLDDDPAAWAAAASYDIRGLTYQAINSDEESWSPKRRREWLKGQAPFSPQPYEQLAGLLMRNGRRQEAWRVLQEERGVRRSAGALHWWEWPGNVVSGLLFGHGYRPEFALVALIVLAGLGWVLYDVAWDAGAVRPTSSTETVVGRCTSTGACFEPWRHSFENAFPFLGLGNRQVWRLDDRVDAGIFSHLAALQVILGWVFATAGVAGLTRRAVKT